MPEVPQPELHRPHATSMAGPYLEFDLSAELQRLKAETTWNSGHNAKTLIKYDDFRVVLIALQSDAHMSEHRSDGRISVQVLSGHVQLRALGRTFDLHAGGMVALDRGVPHDVEAREPSAFLLTIAWPAKE
jgi:quercetin dioxygenase-like cupin family protein